MDYILSSPRSIHQEKVGIFSNGGLVDRGTPCTFSKRLRKYVIRERTTLPLFQPRTIPCVLCIRYKIRYRKQGRLYSLKCFRTGQV